MKIIYTCSTGNNSIIAALLHLGLISSRRHLSQDDLDRYKKYFSLNKVFYKVTFIDKDKDGNEIFILGIPKEKKIIKRLIKSYVKLVGCNPHNIQIIDADKCSNPWITIGIFLSMKLRLNDIGIRFIMKGLQNYSACFLTTAES